MAELTAKQKELINWMYRHTREPLDALTVGAMLAIAREHPDWTWWAVAEEAVNILKGGTNEVRDKT